MICYPAAACQLPVSSWKPQWRGQPGAAARVLRTHVKALPSGNLDRQDVIVPDMSLDEVLAGITSPSLPPAATTVRPPARKQRGRRSKQPSSSPSDSPEHDTEQLDTGSTKAATRLARMLQAARAKTTPDPELNTDYSQPSISDQAASTAVLYPSTPSPPSPAAQQLDVQQQPATPPQPLTPLEQLLAAPIPSPQSDTADERYGLLKTSHKRRSRLFSLSTAVPVTSLSAANQQSRAALQQTRPLQDSSTPNTTTTTSGAQGNTAFISSTRQPRINRRRSSSSTGTNATTTTSSSSRRATQMDDSTATQSSRPSVNSSQGSSWDPTPIQLESWLVSSPNQSSSQPPPAHRPALSRPTTTTPQKLQQPVPPQRPASAAQPPVSRRGRSTVRGVDSEGLQVMDMDMATWSRVAAQGWPSLFSPGYHTSLYEFLVDVWIEAGKAVDRGRAEPAAAACALLLDCWTSRDALVRHTALIALADCLVEHEGLQAHVAAVSQPQAELHNTLVHVMRFLHPDEMYEGGALGTHWLPVTGPKRHRARSASAAPAHADWQQLAARLVALQRVHPSAALGPLVSLLDTSCHPG